MKIYTFLSAGFLTLFLYSCIVLDRGNSYKYLSDDAKKRIVKYQSDSLMTNGMIHEITAVELKKLLSGHSKSLVYIYRNGCTSDYCIPLKQVENFADSAGYNLFFVMTNFSPMDYSLEQPVHHPFFAIDATHYGNPDKPKYIRKFKTELGYENVAGKNNFLGNYLFFERDSLVFIRRTLAN